MLVSDADCLYRSISLFWNTAHLSCCSRICLVILSCISEQALVDEALDDMEDEWGRWVRVVL